MTLLTWLAEEGLVTASAAVTRCRERGMQPPPEVDLLSALAEASGVRMQKNPDGVPPVRVSHDYRSGLVRSPARRKRGRDDDGEAARNELEHTKPEQDHDHVVTVPVMMARDNETDFGGEAAQALAARKDDQGTRHDA